MTEDNMTIYGLRVYKTNVKKGKGKKYWFKTYRDLIRAADYRRSKGYSVTGFKYILAEKETIPLPTIEELDNNATK